MTCLKRYQSSCVPLSGGEKLCLEYYLVKKTDFGNPLYGIRIEACRKGQAADTIYAEEISNLSDSHRTALRVLAQCARLQVTPTDLLSAVDLLMNVPENCREQL